MINSSSNDAYPPPPHIYMYYLDLEEMPISVPCVSRRALLILPLT